MKTRAAQPDLGIWVGDFKFGPRERRYLREVIASNRISYGPFSKKFETAFAAAHGCRYGVFCNSGTSALHASLAALKERHRWKDGDEVLVPSVTFVATANIVLHNRMKPVFVDVDRETYTMDPELMEAKITRRTRAVIPVHLMGLPADMRAIQGIARRRKLRIIEDSCQTFMATCRGRKVGSMGDIGCFSTYVAHYIVTGVGGIATTNDPGLAVRLRSFVNHGRDSIYLRMDDDNDASGSRLHEIVAKRFRFVTLGHSFRATEFEAALGLAQLEQKKDIISARRRNAALLTKGLKDLSDVLQLPTESPDRQHVYMLYPIVLRREHKRGLVNFLEDAGIETREMTPLINQPVYRKLYGNLEPRYPVARWINRSGFYIGCHQYLTREHMAAMIGRIREYFDR